MKKYRFPRLHEHVTRVIMRRLQTATGTAQSKADVVNITIVPLDPSVDSQAFASALEKALSEFGSTLHVSRSRLSDLAGRSVGLVLGVGGARGFAHIGAIRAFREAGIPIDMVGGISMGAVLAALTAILVRGRLHRGSLAAVFNRFLFAQYI